jgi:hypothetical protein
MHGVGEYRWANGKIHKGSYANGARNGIGLYWLPSGDFYQGNYKDDKWDGLQIIQYKATGNTAEAEYQNNLREGLYAEHRSDGIAWFTYSKG